MERLGGLSGWGVRRLGGLVDVLGRWEGGWMDGRAVAGGWVAWRGVAWRDWMGWGG